MRKHVNTVSVLDYRNNANMFIQDLDIDPSLIEAFLAHRRQASSKSAKVKKLTPEQADAKRRRLWISIAKKEIPKVLQQH